MFKNVSKCLLGCGSVKTEQETTGKRTTNHDNMPLSVLILLSQKKEGKAKPNT